MPIKDFPVLGLDGPLRFDGSGSHSPEFVGYSGRRLPHCRTPERLCPQKVHLQSPCKEITQIVKKLPNSAFKRWQFISCLLGSSDWNTLFLEQVTRFFGSCDACILLGAVIWVFIPASVHFLLLNVLCL